MFNEKMLTTFYSYFLPINYASISSFFMDIH